MFNTPLFDRVSNWLFLVLLLVCFVPILIEFSMLEYAKIVEAYERMKLAIKEAPAKAEREIAEKKS